MLSFPPPLILPLARSYVKPGASICLCHIKEDDDATTHFWIEIHEHSWVWIHVPERQTVSVDFRWLENIVFYGRTTRLAFLRKLRCFFLSIVDISVREHVISVTLRICLGVNVRPGEICYQRTWTYGPSTTVPTAIWIFIAFCYYFTYVVIILPTYQK